MSRSLFVNLPVSDLNRTITFYAALGFSFNPDFTDENATCMIIDENIYAMLLRREYFQTFCKKPVADAGSQTGVLLALSCDNRAAVDTIMSKAVAAGGKPAREPQDLGFMYSQAFEDPDGHIWEPFFMEQPQG